jgi:hypothetical protein
VVTPFRRENRVSDEGGWAEIIAECSEPNWDGYGALPVNRQAIVMADLVLARLKSVPRPDLGADPDGEASLDWLTDVGAFTISVSPSGRVAWAMLLNDDVTNLGNHGSIPHHEAETLIPKIQRVLAPNREEENQNG